MMASPTGRDDAARTTGAAQVQNVPTQVPLGRGRPAVADASAAALSVIVIDDEPAIRTLVRKLLEADGRFELVGEATDGAQGLDLVRRRQPDIVLLDLSMPHMDGREALPSMVLEAPTSMVLVLSALRGVDQAASTFADGAFAYVEKSAMSRLPDLMQELHVMFRRALDGEKVWAPGAASRIRL